MRKTRVLGNFVLVLVAVLAVSCSEFKRLQKSTDWQMKYEAALRYYEEEEYYKAGVLFDQVLPIIKGTLDAEKASFYRAYSYFHQGQYILSGSYFNEFATIYSRSDWAIEAAYMAAYSSYLQSPDYNLDQSSTYTAINAFQAFINRNPYSEYAEPATKYIDELQRKLEKKAFENAKQYHKLERWEAARVAFETFADEFPDSKLNEEILYFAVDSEFSYAKQSIRSKQKERYQKTIDLYEDFIDKYPNSEFAKKAEKFYVEALEETKKLSKNS
ncbi:outer membrane protein assembly factor BamD [Reichenbachiella carrageenanivorans]|uniref:Outer membrane protein assembly factor BamD n=1 Tax=Reichenbachiella carrageenanivorans TaxID=2979869 RepID=A0ABY6CZB6_9BACT|nr:outer membrane protein assembly factor BamD [Reichenbachiella carrageenanivorans]UXX79252.1 outer membrane protein assembly factor BamD [Reichenbachiella carrageenanivorans]